MVAESEPSTPVRAISGPAPAPGIDAFLTDGDRRTDDTLGIVTTAERFGRGDHSGLVVAADAISCGDAHAHAAVHLRLDIGVVVATLVRSIASSAVSFLIRRG